MDIYNGGPGSGYTGVGGVDIIMGSGEWIHIMEVGGVDIMEVGEVDIIMGVGGVDIYIMEIGGVDIYNGGRGSGYT